MKRISIRDVMSPEESELAHQLLEGISMSSVNDAWGAFYETVNSEVSNATEDYINSILKNDIRYLRVQELEKRWQKLPQEVRNGTVDIPEADALQMEFEKADEILEEYKNDLNKKVSKIKDAMVSQIISWKVD